MASMYAAGQSMMRHSLAMASNAHALSPSASSRYLTEFEVLREIGKGGFGRVFHVRHRMDHAEYAVKRIRFRQSGFTNTQKNKVLREVHCLARLDHPNIV